MFGSLTSHAFSLAPIVSGVGKFQRHLLRILTKLCLRRGIWLHPGGGGSLLSTL